MDHFGDVLFNFYGSTETGLVNLAKPADHRAAPVTNGPALPGNEIRLLDNDGNELRTCEGGELYVRNKMLVAGYHDDESATRASMRAGFFSVGDLARRDRDGRYFIEGRKRDMIISGGVNVYPAEVEGVLEEPTPPWERSLSSSMSDPEWGSACARSSCAAVGTAWRAELKAWARERLAGPKVPRDFVFLDVMPRNATGKILEA